MKPVNRVNPVAKSVVVALSLGIAAGILFGFGMIAGPLAPSEGHPTLLAWLVFSIVPLLFCLVGTAVARSWPVRIALLAEGIAILVREGWAR